MVDGPLSLASHLFVATMTEMAFYRLARPAISIAAIAAQASRRRPTLTNTTYTNALRLVGPHVV